MMFVLETSPFVLAYRFQYPWPLEKARKQVDDFIFGLSDVPPKLTRSDVISMDVVITAMSGSNRLEYLVASHKLPEHLKTKKVRRRIALERSETRNVGYSYFVYSRLPSHDVWGKSAKQIFLWGRGLDFEAESDLARALAEAIYRKYEGETVKSCLERIGVYLNHDVEKCFQLFSAAINLGYLFIDLKIPVRECKPIRLLSPKDALSPWEEMVREGEIKIDRGRSFPFA